MKLLSLSRQNGSAYQNGSEAAVTHKYTKPMHVLRLPQVMEEDLARMWDTIAKPPQYKDSQIRDFFDVSVCTNAALCTDLLRAGYAQELVDQSRANLPTQCSRTHVFSVSCERAACLTHSTS